jgi:hypothetical protein
MQAFKIEISPGTSEAQAVHIWQVPLPGDGIAGTFLFCKEFYHGES